MYTPNPFCKHYFEIPHINSTECITCNKNKANHMIEKIKEVHQSLGIPEEVYNVRTREKVPYIHYQVKRKNKLHDYPQIVEVASKLPFETMTAITWNNLYSVWAKPDYTPEFISEIDNLYMKFHGSYIDNEDLEYLSNVKILRISNWNFDEEIDHKIFSFEKLEKLTLNHCTVENIPADEVQNSPVKDLELFLYKNIPTWLPNLKNLTKLKIIYPKDETFPYFIPDCDNLRSLRIQLPKITNIPDEHLLNTNLEHLNMYGSSSWDLYLSKIPTGIGQLTNLKSLGLNGIFNQNNNPTGKTPDFINNLTKLEHLFIHGNELNTISEDIPNLRELVSINIGNNRFKTIPSILSSINKLSAIFIQKEDNIQIPDMFENITYSY